MTVTVLCCAVTYGSSLVEKEENRYVARGYNFHLLLYNNIYDIIAWS